MSADLRHPHPGYWQAEGMRHGAADAASRHGAADPADQEWRNRSELIRHARTRGEIWVYEEFGPDAPFADAEDDTFHKVFADQPHHIPSDWVVAYEYGYMQGWWHVLGVWA